MDKPCARCSRVFDLSHFYTRKRGGHHSWCKRCVSDDCVLRQQRLKQACVDYKGGCCEACGYDRYLGALEFHHRDPSKKDFAISRKKLKGFLTDEIKRELDKCMLLCARCHREQHASNED